MALPATRRRLPLSRQATSVHGSSAAAVVVLALATLSVASATVLFTACANTTMSMCVVVDDATVTFYNANSTSLPRFGSGYYSAVLALAKIQFGDPSRPEIVSWTSCQLVPNALGQNTTVNSLSPGQGTGFYNETEFRCHAVVRGRLELAGCGRRVPPCRNVYACKAPTSRVCQVRWRRNDAPYLSSPLNHWHPTGNATGRVNLASCLRNLTITINPRYTTP